MKKIGLLIFTLLILSVSAQKKVVDLDIEKNDDFSTFQILDSAAKDKMVFFTGENHNFRTSNYKLQLKMLKYLYKNFGVNHLFLEFGTSRGWLVNNYVQTGDSTLYDILKKYSYDEYAMLYKELMLFNKTLPADKKIMIHGIDIERSYSTPIKVLSMLLPERKAPKSIELNIEALKSLAGKVDEEHDKDEEDNSIVPYNDYKTNSDRKYYNTTNSLWAIIEDFDSLKTEYITYLEDNAALFEQIITGLRAEFKRDDMLSKNNIQSYIFREQFMFNNLLELMKTYPTEKFYGQFGRCHTALQSQDKWCDFYFFNSLANRINSSDEAVLKNKVLSIGIYYPESNSFEIRASEKDQLNKLFENQDKNGIKLLEINKQDSSLFGGVFDKFQFLILNFEGFKVEETSTNNYNPDPPKKKKFDYGFTFPNIEGHYGYMMMDLKSLAPTFDNYGISNYKSPQNIIGFAATLYEDWFMYGSISAHFLPKQTSNYSDTASLSLIGFFVKGYFGYDVTISETFNVFPRLGVGYGQLSIINEFKNPLPVTSNSSIFTQSPSSKIEYVNGAFLIDPSIDIRFNMRYVALGLNTGYQIDLSKRNWQTYGTNHVGEAPSTHLSGFYAVITLSLFYSIW